jgi:hypothetical protein
MPTCILCRLSFSNRALLELHIREDHPKRNGPREPGHYGTRENKAPRLRPGRSATGAALATSHAGTAYEMNVSAGQWPRSRRVVTALRRAVGFIRHITHGPVRASEVICRAEGGRRSGPRPSPSGGRDAQAATTTQYGEQAA